MARSKIARRREARKASQDWPTLYPGKKPRLYLDNNIPPDFVEALRGKGIDAVHPLGAGSAAHDDGFHWQRTKRLRRTLVTCDLHFWDDQKFPLHDSPGVLILATGARQEWATALALLLGFADNLKMFARGPGAGDMPTRSKIKLSTDRIACRIVTYESKVAEYAWSWSWDPVE